MSWLIGFMRVLVASLILSQIACSTCRIQSEGESPYKALLAQSKQADKSKSKLVPSRDIQRIELSLADGTEHTAIISYPEKAHRELPVLILLGGFDTGEKSLGFLHDDVEMIYATVDYPYKAPAKRGLLSDLAEINAIRTAVRRTDLAIDALIAELQHNPQIDQGKFVFAGASFGAPFAITAAERNPEIDALILIHAFGRADLALTQQISNEWGQWSYPLAYLLGQLAWATLRYPAPESEVQKLHRHQQVLYIYSDADQQLPCESTASLLHALDKSPAQVTTMKSSGGHLAPGKTQMMNELIDVSLKWLKSRHLL